MSLEDLRKEIDSIDRRLLPLLIQRMGVSQRVAEEKQKQGIPVLNTAREQQILDRVAAESGADAPFTRRLYSDIMEVSRAKQHMLLGGGEPLRNRIQGALCGELPRQGKKVACAGVQGAYASEAALKLFASPHLEFCTGFEEVFRAVETGRADFGVVPVENSTAGSVHEVYDLVLKYRFSIVDALDLPICHCLVAKQGTAVQSIQKVVSHPQALAQCKEYIQAHGLASLDYSNTAAAARFVAECGEAGIAAIASEETARLYGLDILERGIQAAKQNATRFIVISKQMIIPQDGDKISLIFTLPHTTGSLYSILGRFALSGLNLTKIESRPIQDSNFSYYFYLDFTGNVRQKETLDLLCSLSEELPVFEFLGNFHEQGEGSI